MQNVKYRGCRYVVAISKRGVIYNFSNINPNISAAMLCGGYYKHEHIIFLGGARNWDWDLQAT